MRALLSLVLLLAVGCGDDDLPVTADGGTPIPDASRRDVVALPLPDAGPDARVAPPLDTDIVAFCVDLSESLCAAFERCACGATDAATCREGYRMQCELYLFGPDVRLALAEGRLLFDATAAARMVTALADPAVCTARTIEPWTVRDYYTFGGILEGTRRAGEDCTPIEDTYGYVRSFRIDECAEGVCDAGRCVELVGVGETCGGDRFCADLDARVEFFWDVRQINLPCERPAPEAPGVCGARRVAGARCDRNSDCESYRCDPDTRRCAALAGVGDPCAQQWDCESGFCSPPGWTCAEGDLPLGSSCGYSPYECASGYCAWHEAGGQTCTASVCSIGAYGGLQQILPRR